jgi:guanine nucleotide-binding protein G(I)/G(S)/G(T) subunit beta-1
MADYEKQQAEIEKLKDEVKSLREQAAETKTDALKDQGSSKDIAVLKTNLKYRKRLGGHFGKIYAFDWAPDSRKLVSAAQDGNLFVWDGVYSLKNMAIVLRSSWVMTASFSPSGKFMAAGGLDNLCTVYRYEDQAAYGVGEGVVAELNGHEGYLSTAIFLDDNNIFTTSGDSSAALWNIENREIVTEFRAHQADVMCASQNPHNRDVFVTGSVDSSAMLWDVRASSFPQRTFLGHESDINAITFFPDGNAFICGSDDSTCRLFDMRSAAILSRYQDDRIVCGVTSLAVNKTGRLLVASYDDGPVVVWDTIFSESVQKLEGHTKRISCLRAAPDGSAFGTSSWDSTIMIWA